MQAAAVAAARTGYACTKPAPLPITRLLTQMLEQHRAALRSNQAGGDGGKEAGGHSARAGPPLLSVDAQVLITRCWPLLIRGAPFTAPGGRYLAGLAGLPCKPC